MARSTCGRKARLPPTIARNPIQPNRRSPTWKRAASTGRWSVRRCGTGLERAGAGGGAQIPRPLRDHGLFYLDDPRGRDLVAHWRGAAGHGQLALLYRRPPPAILVHRRYARLALAGGGVRRRAGLAGSGDVPADGRPDRRAPPRPEADR